MSKIDDAARPFDNKAAFEEICAMLHAGHGSPKHPNLTPSETLNRLFVKNLGGPAKAPNAPTLTPDNVSIKLEKRPKPDLRKLASRQSSRPPARLDLPVVVVCYRGEERLIDGGSRCHYWHVNGQTDDHGAWVLTVKDAAGTATEP
jgi:hypothetical protein